MFELGERIKPQYKFPTIDVDTINLEEYLGELLREHIKVPGLSELELVRHFTNLSKLNYSVDTNFYPLGSCSMKYNPRINEELASLSEFWSVHPLTSEPYCQGSLRVMYELKERLKKLGSFAEVCLQPAAGAHGEFLGLLLVNAYHTDKGNKNKRKVLIPDSAHGTNPASAAICGFDVVTIKSDQNGELDWEDFKKHLSDDVACLMITNPNTLGIFERKIKEIAQALHELDALLYMDGANFNALVGIAKPGDWGVDIMHFNLHKTFSTPHGGGGPGGGAVGVSEKLVDYLPVPQVELKDGKLLLNWDKPKSIGKLLSFYGHFGVMVRALAYILSYGREIDMVSKYAVLNARYLRHLLKELFIDPYEQVPCMHEFVLSASNLNKYGVTALDVAKKLLDFGFYSPTVYFPLILKEALMIEPTETESPKTLEDFAKALKDIVNLAKENAQELKEAPTKTPVKRIKEAQANRNPIVRWEDNYLSNK